MIVTFSGTGNSRYCGQFLADKLDDELLDCFHYIKHGIQAELISGKPWIFVAPTYAWQLPHVFMDFIRSSWLQGSRDVYFVMTCGSDIGGAAAYNEQLCQELQLNYKGTLKVAMPENYIALFDVPSEEKCEKMLTAAQQTLSEAAVYMSKNEALPQKKVSPLGKVCSSLVNKGFNQYYIKADKFYATAKCIGCGKCAELCVLNNISLKDGLPQWGKNCTHCMACICHCPVEAIEYGNVSRGKRRYRCPEYKK